MRYMCHFGQEGEVGNSEADEKEETFGKQILAGHSETMGRRGIQ